MYKFTGKSELRPCGFMKHRRGIKCSLTNEENCIRKFVWKEIFGGPSYTDLLITTLNYAHFPKVIRFCQTLHLYVIVDLTRTPQPLHP